MHRRINEQKHQRSNLFHGAGLELKINENNNLVWKNSIKLNINSHKTEKYMARIPEKPSIESSIML